MKESKLYKPVQDILIKKFKSMGRKVHIEITSDGTFSRGLKEVLDIETVNILRVERLRPDLTGYYEEKGRNEIIIVEVKAKEITLMDISQAKTYADIFNAHYCILVSSKRLGREKRMFIRSKSLTHRDYKEKLVIAWFCRKEHMMDNDIIIEPEVLRDLHYDTLPKPFAPTNDTINYWLTPVRSDKERSAEEVVETLVSEEGIYAFGDRTPGRNHLKPGDWICFYASGKGVIGHARVLSRPEKDPHPMVNESEKYPWTFRVGKDKLYLDNPIKIDAKMRKKLDAFKGKDHGKFWGLVMQTTRKISEKDFKLLTR